MSTAASCHKGNGQSLTTSSGLRGLEFTSTPTFEMLDLDYSDSDASDSEQIATAPPPAQALPSPKKPSSLSAFLPKPKSRKHKDSRPDQDRPKKIVVALPKFDDDDDDEDRPAKRARTDGGSGLSAMLPAPKRAGAMKVDSAPMRDIVTEKISKDTEREDSQNHNGVGEQEKESDVRKPSTTTNPMFVPQSVTRKPIQPMSAFKKGPALKPKPQPTKPKVSLFGSAATMTNKPQPKVNRLKIGGEYKPIMVEAAKPLPKPEDDAEYVEEFSYLDNGAASLQPSTHVDPSSIAQPADDLDALARGAGLDEQAMRQLYGRNGPGREAIKVSTFSVDDEYKQNELERSLGLVQDAKPVRNIAPGRHQLQSLLNNAQSQRTALEDSFARGKSNRKEAGSKYGW